MRTFTLTVALAVAFVASGCGWLINGPAPDSRESQDADVPAAQTDADQDAQVAAVKTWQGPPPRLLVLPSENSGSPKSYGAYTFILTESLAETLEDEPEVKVLNAPMVLTREQAQIVQPDGTAFNAEAAREMALKMGATHYLTGRTSGQSWSWDITVEIYAVTRDGPAKLAASGQATGSLIVKSRPSAIPLYETYATAVSRAFDALGLPLSPRTVQTLRAPPSSNAYALLQLSRAYAKNFWRDTEDAEQAEEIMKAAERAVRIDPRNPAAQRFYAYLLQESGQPRAAMPHYAVAISERPNDVRSLLRLGVIEAQEGHPTSARRHLGRAIELRPDDADTRYWFGRASLALEDETAAMEAFQQTERIDPHHVDCRRELVKLYTARQRYVDAIRELRVIVNLAPDDRMARFDLGACVRAIGHDAEAASVYGMAADRFPANPLFHKFRGDALARAGDAEGARRSYWKARVLNYTDRRTAYILGKAPLITVPPLGAYTLTDATKETDGMRQEMDRLRGQYCLGMNDAILDLATNGEHACLDGHGASSALFALQAKDSYDELYRREASIARRMEKAKANGEWMWLTPDERKNADRTLASAQAADQDAEEMRTQFARTFRPLYVRAGCDTYDGPITPATEEQVRERLRSREISMPEFVRPPMLPISPVVPPNLSLVISFTVDNSEGDVEQKVVLDGNVVATVQAGATANVNTSPGPHELCIAADPSDCARPEMVRQVNLYDGWTIQIR